MKLSGWGNYPVIESETHNPRDISDVLALVQSGKSIARGNGRSYGESAIGFKNTVQMKHFNRLLAFNSDSGQLVAEAGVLLADIVNTFLPRGWFLAVTPGTKFVTLGGMIAADVHGKNHHKSGSFGKFLDWIDIVTGEGKILRCSSTKNAELFAWTIGGMGLTGIILRAAIRLVPVQSAWIKQHTLVGNNIDHTIELFEGSLDTTYSVAWIDCLQTGKKLGRSLVILGEHATPDLLSEQHKKAPFYVVQKRKLRIPFYFPRWVLNNFSMRIINEIYYFYGRISKKNRLVDWDSFFYPLDSILGWNKIYGKTGFAQFQCVIPLACASDGLNELILTIANAKVGSCLAVLKRLGKQESKFSFPMEGYTLSIDFPVNQKSLVLMDSLDRITLKYGGRFYLAKDSRMSKTTFWKSEGRVKNFQEYRNAKGNPVAFQSIQSVRLDL